MKTFLLWYVLIFFLGLIGFPITFRVLGNLKDRGYTLVKTLSLLVWGYLFWILCILGVVQNNLGGVLFALMIYVGISIFSLRGKWDEIREWVKQNYRILLLSEAVFLIAFAFWAMVRAANPALIGTEKPMELAFINAILKSPSFPPNDPWLSGYSISYYYFGYVIVSMLIRVTGTSSTIAFNLMIALIFGLVAVNAFGILNNLLQSKYGRKNGSKLQVVKWLSGLLAPLFILLMGNLEGFLEMLHAKGIFWTQDSTGVFTSRFWTWLKMPEVENPPSLPLTLVPNRQNGYWWWRASRVVQDFKISDERIEIIDEFPQFSFILADMHPHVLAMPFVLLAVGIILNLFLGEGKSAEGKLSFLQWITQKFFSNQEQPVSFQDTYLYSWLGDAQFWLIAIVTGGIAFFNTWDFPVYVGLLCLSTVLYQYRQSGWSKFRWIEFFETGILTGIVGIILYLPYYLGFDSQAGGFLPSINFYTRGIYFWIMFGGLLLPILGWLLWNRYQEKQPFGGKFSRRVTLGLVFGLWGFSYLFAIAFLVGGSVLSSEKVQGWLGLFYWLQGGVTGRNILLQSLVNRFREPVTWLTLLVVLYLVWGLLAGRLKQPDKQVDSGDDRSNHATGFVLLLVLLGAGLTLVPEFVYLQDQFGTRMNTIFKFYFQTWILWSLAASFGMIVLWKETRGFGRLATQLVSVVLIGLGLIYPTFAILNTTNNLKPETYQDGEMVPDWSLDGALYRARSNPDEWSAILWLKEDAPLGVVAEAVGGSYTEYARVATYSGMPNVLGWPGHESQWRGGGEEMGSRESDMETLYRSGKWDQVKLILDQYNIRYIFLGNLEKIKYGADGKVFTTYLVPVFQSGETAIFEYISSE